MQHEMEESSTQVLLKFFTPQTMKCNKIIYVLSIGLACYAAIVYQEKNKKQKNPYYREVAWCCDKSLGPVSRERSKRFQSSC